MGRDVVFCKGTAHKPLVVFIHGMGMDANVWSNPLKARVMGGKYPLTILLDNHKPDLKSLFMELADRGFDVLTWSQERPVGPIMAAVAELHALIKAFKRYADSGVVLIGHSRGGLIARKYLERRRPYIKGLFTIATPHHGTTMARWAAALSPFAAFAGEAMDKHKSSAAKSALQRVLLFFASSGLKELLPESSFYAGLKDKKNEHVLYASAAGTNPDLLKIRSVSLSGFAARVLPRSVIPEEIKKGYGDGLVSVSSAVLPFADHHRNFHANHMSLLFNKAVREYFSALIENL